MRQSGILMHITSLPGPWGVGTMGKSAYAFVDFLRSAGQSLWQLLPLTPTGYGDSPYQSCSAYAGNHYLIDLDLLCEQSLLKPEEIASRSWGENPERVDFGLIYQSRLAILRLAYSRFTDDTALDRFCAQQEIWLPDFALFMVLKDLHGGSPWYQWEPELKFRHAPVLARIRQENADQIRFYCFVQYLFHTQWTQLRDYAHAAGIRIVGDVPIYVPYDSVEVWTQPQLFDLDEELVPQAVAGCPPDCFNEDGQLWGNPLYRWEQHAAQGFDWWVNRMQAASERYDLIRLDHFRGFESYWAVPYGDPTARGGQWLPGPGMDFVNALRQRLPQAQMIAEDLGFLTEPVRQLLQQSGYPGMKVLGFAFDSREPSDYLPHTYPENSVCYTATHDNMTTRQWFETAADDAVEYAAEYMHLTPEEGYVWGTIRTALSSVSRLCVIPMQDCLELGAAARMNFPGTQSSDNWTWRALPGFDDPALAEKLCRMTRLYGRIPCEKRENEDGTDQPPARNGESEYEV